MKLNTRHVEFMRACFQIEQDLASARDAASQAGVRKGFEKALKEQPSADPWDTLRGLI